MRERERRRGRDRVGEEQKERERGRDRIPSRLLATSAEANLGLKLRNHEIMT